MKWIKIILNSLKVLKPIYATIVWVGTEYSHKSSQEKHDMAKEVMEKMLPNLRKRYGFNSDDLDVVIKFAVLIWKRFVLKKTGSLISNK